MLTFYDSQNNAHVLGERLGSGGEGTVYACEKIDLVAKIYHEPVDDGKAEKLRWMAENKNEQLLKIAAWVVDVLTDAPGGRVVGFLMPNVKAKEIHELYSLKSRRVYFPEATWHFLVHSAANLARAFFILHKNAHIMGDINHGNCVVLADGTVKLIDCDSYSIKTDKMRYPCEVGVATHLAPELQGADLAEVERENKHDNFGLAVIIFQLLFLGRHPFAGNYLGTEDKSLEDCIREIRFAYGDNTEFTKIQQPPGTLSLSEVSPRVATLFERAFWTQDRPEPREWIEALEDLSTNLGQCSLHPGHYYFKELVACPWCRLESKTGLMLFPFVTSGIGGNGEKPFNIFTIENLIANLGLTQNLPAKLPPTDVLPPPSPEILEEKTIVQNRRNGVMVGHFFALILLMALFGVGITFFIGVILMVFFVYLLVDFEKLPKSDVEERLVKTKSAWDELENEWNQAFLPQNLNNDLAQIRLRISDYQKFQQTSVKKMTLLHGENRRRELEKYLRTFHISNTKGLSIDERERKALISRGVKTAAEVEKGRLSYFHSIDDKVITSLLEWRKEIERNFEFDNKAELPETEKAELVQETSLARRKIEREIENLFGSLRSASVGLRQRQKQLFSKSEVIAKQFQQAKSDAAVIGSNAGAIATLLLMTFFMPLFGIVVTKSNEPPNYRPKGSSSPVKRITDTTTVLPNISSKDSLSVYDIPDESITDKEIAALSADKKVQIINALIEESNTSIADEDYKSAEQSMHFALRFNTDKVRVLYQLGYVLYEQKKYTASIKHLKDALKIDPENEGVKTFIGSNYLKMKRFAEAKKMFIEVTDKFPNSSNGFYNLGLANKQMNDYPAAIEAFEQALAIEPDNVDAIYNLGVCFYKMGDKESAQSQYYSLFGKDTGRAEKLRKEANLQTALPTLSGSGGGNGNGIGTGRVSGVGNGEGIGYVDKP